IAAWPTKLALAPLLAERIIALLPTLDVQPQPLNLQMLADWPRPEIAPPPWDWEHLQWS
ncbi:MAG: glycerol-3-phosphate dehydrogenase, partial [Synechococcaceae cyanobacterium SM1_2_3]|nr:glycerol-3-phosphate dehydrogenase [Synechococcaceae cyanobacterium SM1_2_3]